MTQEEKAKAYDEALRQIKECTPDENGFVTICPDEIFPELKEIEDERIRKDLIKWIEEFPDSIWRGHYTKDVIAWLEKQGEIIDEYEDKLDRCACESFDKGYKVALEEQREQETTCNKCRKAQPSHSCQDITELGRCYAEHEQKPADKVEPTFKVGDWIVQKSLGIYKIIEVCESWYEVISYNDGTQYSIGFDKEKDCHLWTINDAKDGDILSQDNIPFIFKTWDNDCIAYCGITDFGLFEVVEDDFSWCNGVNIIPATKEQRNLLFQKMKDAGYGWDSEKKKLKIINWYKHIKCEPNSPSITENPTDKIEPKFNFKVGQWIVAAGKCVFLITKIDGFNVTLVETNGDESVFDAGSLDDAHLWTIQDAKDGDVLAEDSCIFIIQKLGDNGSAAKTYCTLHSDGDFDDGTILYFDVDSTNPATKEQRDLLFQKMKEAGYEWVTEKRELRKIEHERSSDKVEPKFHEGEWIVWQNKCYKVNYNGCGYELIDQNGLRTSLEYGTVDNSGHLWTLNDAKDGDVLATQLSPEGDWIGIYKASVDIIGFKTHCFLNTEGEFVTNPNRCRNHGTYGLYPATKEQRDTLTKAMTDAGYAFDFENKELKKIS